MDSDSEDWYDEPHKNIVHPIYGPLNDGILKIGDEIERSRHIPEFSMCLVRAVTGVTPSHVGQCLQRGKTATQLRGESVMFFTWLHRNPIWKEKKWERLLEDDMDYRCQDWLECPGDEGEERDPEDFLPKYKEMYDERYRTEDEEQLFGFKGGIADDQKVEIWIGDKPDLVEAAPWRDPPLSAALLERNTLTEPELQGTLSPI